MIRSGNCSPGRRPAEPGRAPENGVHRLPKTLRTAAVFAVAVVLVLVAESLLGGLAPALPAARSASEPSPLGTHAARAATGASTSAAAPASPPAPAANTFNPPCYKINLSICVSIKLQGESSIVPYAPSHVSPVLPNPNTSLPLVVKSRYRIDWFNAPPNGPRAPLALNVTCRLWNGDPYYSEIDSSVWHSDSTTWWTPPRVTGNLTDPYWYDLNISAKAANNVPNFFAGETCTWWIWVGVNETNVVSHFEGPHLQFTYSGAWPYSPYPQSPVYGGSSAAFLDVGVGLYPRDPNWNDSVLVALNTTTSDSLTNATIGSAYAHLSETLPNGGPTTNVTLTFPVPGQGAPGAGTNHTVLVIPPSYAQVANTTVSLWLTVYDAANPSDQLTTSVFSYQVNGNGSFTSGIFSDDLALTTSPESVQTLGVDQATVLPGQPVSVTLISRNPTTAISAAEIDYTFTYPLLGESAPGVVPFVRINSTFFEATLPGLPLGSVLNFTVAAWDFNQRLEVSPQLGYSTPGFATFVPALPQNETFFYVFVYDNGSGAWVSGAQVQVRGTSGFVNSVGTTVYGVAYPNETKGAETPLLLATNTQYNVTVNDPLFVPAGGRSPGPIAVAIAATNPMTTRQTLSVGDNYLVVQEGNAIVFWLNATLPPPPASPPAFSGGVPIGAILGLVGAVVAALPVLAWWTRIRARRREEEKRVTL